MKALYKKEAAPGIWMKTDAPIPTIGANDVLIKIKKMSICGSDIHMFKWDEWSQKNVKPGLIMGHEYVGVIDKIGSEVQGLFLGDRVTGENHIPCNMCRNCRSGKKHICISQIAVGFTRPGAFAEYLSLPASNVVKVPDNISDDFAAIFDPLGNAVHTGLSFRSCRRRCSDYRRGTNRHHGLRCMPSCRSASCCLHRCKQLSSRSR